MESDISADDICRVCRSEGYPDRPLFHPCICTGSIKWIHQECLVQWMRYSRKGYCELCRHRFSFTPIYSPDMPRRLPLRDVAGGLLSSVATAVKYWLHYTIVAIAWLGIVPLTACRIYRFLFYGSLGSLLKLPFDLISTQNIATDVCHGFFIVMCGICGLIGLIWLREQILHGGGPDWLEHENPPVNPGDNGENVPNQEQPVAGENNNIPNEEGNDQPIPPPNEEIEQAPLDVAALAAEPVGDEANWNPMEWDRAGEELTWEHLLGLDGSLVFIEHVFWVVSLNTLFILIFAFAPYHIGRATISVLGLREQATASNFEGLVTTLCGYCVIGLGLICLHYIAGLFGFRKSRRILGLCYVVVKVSLLAVVEVGVLPLISGWWLDICSLSMFDATLKDRENSFKLAPGTSMFLHWLVGIVYVYYFASFILLLREVLRPGVLWFLRNLNDPDFSPIQEMIHLPIIQHIRRLLCSAVIFGTAVLLMLWLPVRILRAVWPSFLPYTVALHIETQVNELSLELLLLQVILPALLEQSHTRQWLKSIIRTWCRVVAWILDLHSYLLGDESNNNPPAPMPPENNGPVGGGLGAAHQALLQRGSPTGFQPYTKPKFLAVRLVALLLIVCISLVASSLIALTLPVWIGRQAMELWLTGAPPPSPQPPTPGRVHELYTAACGTYFCWLACRGLHIAASWLPQGRAAMIARVKHWVILGARSFAACTVLLGVIPLLFGLLLELVVAIPLRVPLHQTPVHFIWQDWALGVLYTKIACAVIMMGPDWRMRATIERAYRDGIREMDLQFILLELATPVIVSFGLSLAIPYVIAYSIVPVIFTSPRLQNEIASRVYPYFSLIVLLGGVIIFQIRQFKKLYEHIKNDKYLVGQRLVNYDHRKSTSQTNASHVTVR